MSVIIRLQNLPLSAGASDVRAFFSGLKIPDGSVHIIGGPQGDVFIGFGSDEDARQAMRKDRELLHNSEVRLYLSSKNEMSTVIEQAKAGVFNTPAGTTVEPPIGSVISLIPSKDHANANGWPLEKKNRENSYVAQPSVGYKASFGNGISRQDDSSMPAYARLPPPAAPVPPLMSTKPEIHLNVEKERFDRDYDRYSRNNNNSDSRNSTDNYNQSNRRGSAPNPPRRGAQYSSSNSSTSELRYPPSHRERRLHPDSKPNHDDFVPPISSDSWRSTPKPMENGPSNYNGNSNYKIGAKKTLLGNGAPPSLIPPKPFIPKIDDSRNEKYYIELTRLPNDLLRPASLEEFIAPSRPLSLSSVKVVFGPGGIHLHTLVRLDNQSDLNMILARDGEMGIKIRKSSKKDFDEAIDDPVASKTTERRSPDRDRKDSRRDRRRHSPDRKRRRYSPEASSRSKHSDPTRWCIQIVNAPFKVKEEELYSWFAEKVRPAKLTRTYYPDGNASDRWIAEFSSESLMNRAFAIRSLCLGRSLRLSYIDNDAADEILKIKDIYGEEKRKSSEAMKEMTIRQMYENQVQYMEDISNKRAKVDEGNENRQLPAPSTSYHQSNVPPPSFFFGGANSLNFGSKTRGTSTRGRGTRGAHQSYGAQRQPPSNPGSYYGNTNGNQSRRPIHDGPDEINQTRELINSIGPSGTVLVCSGFPRDVTLEEVMKLFSIYGPDQNSIRIRRDEDGIMTGECMLACRNPQKAEDAARHLNGHTIGRNKISVSLANPL